MRVKEKGRGCEEHRTRLLTQKIKVVLARHYNELFFNLFGSLFNLFQMLRIPPPLVYGGLL